MHNQPINLMISDSILVQISSIAPLVWRDLADISLAVNPRSGPQNVMTAFWVSEIVYWLIFFTSLLTSWHGKRVSMGLHHFCAGGGTTVGAQLQGRGGGLLRPCGQYSSLWNRSYGKFTPGWQSYSLGGCIIIWLQQILCIFGWSRCLRGVEEWSHILIWCTHQVTAGRSMKYWSCHIYPIE